MALLLSDTHGAQGREHEGPFDVLSCGTIERWIGYLEITEEPVEKVDKSPGREHPPASWAASRRS